MNVFLEELKRQVEGCTRCVLHESRTRVVFGEGDGPFMMVGEAPGRQEDIQGRPFVGQAGRLLDELLRESGMDRNRFFITNVVKCRPPGNRNPRPEEIEACRPYLDRQVEILRPPAMVALGRFSGTTLLGRERLITLKDYRGRVLESIYGVPMLITYHPASVFRNPRLRDYILEDFRLFYREFYSSLLDGPVPGNAG